MDNRPGAVGDLQGLYRETIRRHAAEPVGYRREIEATHRHEEYNALCGDRIEVALQISEERVLAAAFEGEACAICMASASLLCEHAAGESVGRIEQLGARLNEALQGDETAAIPEELAALQGVRPYPSRIRCATLPWTAAVRAARKAPE